MNPNSHTQHEVILVTDQFTPESILNLKAEVDGEILQTNRNPTKAELQYATAMLIRSRTKIDKKLIEQAPKLKVIVTATSGFDHIDMNVIREKEITAMFTPEANSQSAAELAIFLILASLRKATAMQGALRDGKWKDHFTPGRLFNGQNFGIIGLGRVGSRVAKMAQAFGANVLAYDPYQNDEVFETLKITRQGLSEVFAQSDILSFHVPLNSETRRMVRAETIELMQDGVILINTSRGQVFDESALVAALETGEVSAAGLDVFENEPLARESRLRKLSNVVLTPHVGAYTDEAFQLASQMATDKCLRFLKRGESSDLIPFS